MGSGSARISNGFH